MISQSKLFLALKKALKVKKIPYGEIARRLKVSEATIKRMFSVEECTLARFLEICEIAEVTLQGLCHASEQLESNFEIDDDVAAYLAENIEVFIFFVKLFEHKTLEALLQNTQLERRSLTRYLKELEKLKLIERLPGDKVRLVNKTPYSSRHPELVRTFLSRWSPVFMGNVVEYHGDGKHFLKANSLHLTATSRQAFLVELDALRKKFDDIEGLERDIGVGLENVGVVIGIGPYRFGDGLPVAEF